eukprot:Nk52_evm1s1872 gene=Nk52_evmTU1s1872
MPELFESAHTFNHSWEQVTSGVWQKYPNEKAPQMHAVDTLSTRVDAASGELERERLMTTKWDLPGWVSGIIGDGYCYCKETTTVDPKTKTFTMKSVNLSASSFIRVEETCKYTPHPEDPSRKTLLEQEATVSVFGLRFGTSSLENTVVSRMAAQVSKGRDALDEVVTRISAASTAQT